MENRITIMDKILYLLYMKGREHSPAQISRSTKLTPNQVKVALRRMYHRGLISRRYEKTKARRRVPPNPRVFVKVRDLDYARKVLESKGMI